MTGSWVVFGPDEGELRYLRPPARSGLEGAWMDVHLITDSGIEQRTLEELPELLQQRAGLVWVDIPKVDDEAIRLLSEVFRFHPLAIQDCEDGEEILDLAQMAEVLGRLQVALHFFTVGGRNGKTNAAHRDFPPQ